MSDEGALSVEVFLSEAGVCLAAPRGCGLDQADSLSVDVENRKVIAMLAGSELPVDLPMLSTAHCQALVDAGEVAVGEFVVQGVAGAYMVRVVETPGRPTT